MIQHSELKWAHEQVMQSRRHVESAFQELEQKFESGREMLDRAIYQAQAPVRLAKQYPLASAGVFALAGLLIGMRFFGRDDSNALRLDEFAGAPSPIDDKIAARESIECL